MSEKPMTREEIAELVQSASNKRELERKELSDAQKLAIRAEIDAVVGRWARLVGITSIVALLTTVGGMFAYVATVVPNAALDQATRSFDKKFAEQVPDLEKSMKAMAMSLRDLECERNRLQTQIAGIKVLTPDEVTTAVEKVKAINDYIKPNTPTAQVVDKMVKDDSERGRALASLTTEHNELMIDRDFLFFLMRKTGPILDAATPKTSNLQPDATLVEKRATEAWQSIGDKRQNIASKQHTK
jgi:hypothetical protein